VEELVQLQLAFEELVEQIGWSWVFWTSDAAQQEHVLLVEVDVAQLHWVLL
jgi:hypothetical protein